MGSLRVGPRAQLTLELAEPSLPLLDARRRGTKFLALPVRRVLNDATRTGMPFWSINPYVGCEFGCAYCYARDTHKWAMERADAAHRLDDATAADSARLPAWEAFEKQILIKCDAPRVLEQTLDPSKLGGRAVVIGTATDPYQPAERQFLLTRSILEALLKFRGLRIGLITKSPLVTRDTDLLVRLADRHEVTVNISLATLDSKLARRLEARSPVPRVRIAALRTLRRAGIPTGLLIAPILPAITDSWSALAALFEAARDAGAQWVHGVPLRLGPAARARFLPVLRAEFPELARRYEEHFAHRQHTSRDYGRALRRRIVSLQEAFGFETGSSL